jgi:hypothetical protein
MTFMHIDAPEVRAEMDLELHPDADLPRDPREPVTMLQDVRIMLGSLEARRLARN